MRPRSPAFPKSIARNLTTTRSSRSSITPKPTPSPAARRLKPPPKNCASTSSRRTSVSPTRNQPSRSSRSHPPREAGTTVTARSSALSTTSTSANSPARCREQPGRPVLAATGLTAAVRRPRRRRSWPGSDRGRRSRGPRWPEPGPGSGSCLPVDGPPRSHRWPGCRRIR